MGFYSEFKTYFRLKIMPKFGGIYDAASAKADTKLGFIGGALGSVVGGIPAWLTTRLVFAAIIGIASLGLIDRIRSDAQSTTALKYERAMTAERDAARAYQASREEELAAKIEKIDLKWKSVVDDLMRTNTDLEAALAKTTNVGVCWPKPVTDVIRKKAIGIGKKRLK